MAEPAQGWGDGGPFQGLRARGKPIPRTCSLPKPSSGPFPGAWGHLVLNKMGAPAIHIPRCLLLLSLLADELWN